MLLIGVIFVEDLGLVPVRYHFIYYFKYNTYLESEAHWGKFSFLLGGHSNLDGCFWSVAVLFVASLWSWAVQLALELRSWRGSHPFNTFSCSLFLLGGESWLVRLRLHVSMNWRLYKNLLGWVTLLMLLFALYFQNFIYCFFRHMKSLEYLWILCHQLI